MKRNILLGGICFYVVISLVTTNCLALSNGSINTCLKEQPNLQYSITTNIDTIRSIFQYIIITVTIKNLGNETLSLDIGGYPGGRLSIIDDNNKLINMCPKYFLTLLWKLTLEPQEEYTLYRGIWFQRTIFGRLVRNGEYFIVGGTSVIYCNGEPVSPDSIGPANITITRRFIS